MSETSGGVDGQDVAITDAERRKIQNAARRAFMPAFRKAQGEVGMEGVTLSPCKAGSELHTHGGENIVCGYSVSRPLFDVPTKTCFTLTFSITRYRWKDYTTRERPIKTETQYYLKVERCEWYGKSESYPLTKEGFASALSHIGTILANNRRGMAINSRRRRRRP
jgi:hypothetical protein